jgi:mannose-6-phosphate isomerase
MFYPYKFDPVLVERVWGGRVLAKFGKSLPANKYIGETWEISDRDDAQTIVANGPDKGKTLRQLIETNGADAIIGRARPPGAPQSRFPLLVKLLDARERLSLQVHPPAHLAAKLHGEPKTEMWYILDTAPGASLIAGLRRGVTAPQFMRALEWTQKHKTPPPPPTLGECVYRFPVMPGDTFFVPSGRLHAIDAGVTLVEIQQNSDTTYRVYDWDRVGLDGKPRQLHVNESLVCIDFQDFEPKKQKPKVESRGVNGLWRLVECDYFCVHKLELRNAELDRCDGSTFHILACVDGAVGILLPDGKEEHLNPGEFTLLPAALGFYTLTPQAENTSVLKVFVPSADRAV